MTEAAAPAPSHGPVAPSEGWFTDPSGRYQWRWFDGRTWTPYVATGSWQGVDPPIPGPTPSGATGSYGGQGGVSPDVTVPVAQRSGPVFDAPDLAIYRQPGAPTAAAQDTEGRWVGFLRPTGVSDLRRAMAVVTQSWRYTTRRFELVDAANTGLLSLDAPAAVFTGSVIVREPGSGIEIGRVVQYDADERYFTFEAGYLVAAVSPRPASESGGEDLIVVDSGRRPVGTLVIDPSPGPGLPPATRLVRHGPLGDPLRSLLVAFALSFDLVFGTGRCGVG
jgi:hypothetical protein